MDEKVQRDELTPAQAAEYLKVARTTVYDWLRSGKLRARRMVGRWRISRAAIAEFEKSTEYTPPVVEPPPAPRKRRK